MLWALIVLRVLRLEDPGLLFAHTSIPIHFVSLLLSLLFLFYFWCILLRSKPSSGSVGFFSFLPISKNSPRSSYVVIVLPEHQTERIGTNTSLPYRLASNRREGLQTARGNCITTILRDSDLLYTVLAFLHSSTEPLGLISQHLAGVERGERGYFSLACIIDIHLRCPPGMEFASHRLRSTWCRGRGLVWFLGAFCVLFSSFLPVIPDYERVTTLIFLLDLYLFIIQFFLFISFLRLVFPLW